MQYCSHVRLLVSCMPSSLIRPCYRPGSLLRTLVRLPTAKTKCLVYVLVKLFLYESKWIMLLIRNFLYLTVSSMMYTNIHQRPIASSFWLNLALLLLH